jgi:hypothetical protein
VTAKSNEIPAVRDLLTAFTDLAGAVMTIDALGSAVPPRFPQLLSTATNRHGGY